MLNTIKVGDRLELRGRLYTGENVGINWVHTNCGASPSSDMPDGWVREINKDGSGGDNMEAKQDFCSFGRTERLWREGRADPGLDPQDTLAFSALSGTAACDSGGNGFP